MTYHHEERFISPPNFNSEFASCYKAKTMPSVILSLLDFCPEAIINDVGTSLCGFWSDFLSESTRVLERNLAEYAKACKERYKLFRSTATLMITQISSGNEVFICDKDGYFYPEGFLPTADRSYIGITQYGECAITKLIAQCHPRSYRKLYEGLKIIGLYSQQSSLSTEERVNILSCYLVVAQSIGQSFELLKFTDYELLEFESNWIKTITDKGPGLSDELAQMLELVFDDMKSANPPNYISDLVSLKRDMNRFIENRKWNVEDYASRSTTASASREKLNSKMPNKHILMSMYEQDCWSFKGDKLIGYYSNYPEDDSRVPEGVAFRTVFIPKTSRGYRAIGMCAGPIKDRANYFLKGIQPLLKRLQSDCTFNQSLGSLFVQQTTKSGKYWAISLDLESATDYVDQTVLRHVWSELFGSEVAEYLLELSTGRTVVSLHNKEGKLYETIVNQTRGIKQGIPFVFELGLTLLHHIIIRCVMKSLGLEKMNSHDFYRLLGDDSFARMAKDGLKYIELYTKLMTLAGFKVHSVQKKGICTSPNSGESLGEFSKKVYFNGSIISPIPFKLFFKDLSLENEVARLDWLTQYKCFEDYLPVSVDNLLYRFENLSILPSVIQIFNRYEIMGLKLPVEIPVSEDEEIQIISEFCYQALRHSVVASILNPKGRLSREKEDQQFEFFKKANISLEIQQLQDYAHGHGVEVTTLDFVNITNSYILERAKDLLEGTQLEDYIMIHSFQESEIQIIHQVVEILADLQSARESIPHQELIRILLGGKKFITSIRQHDVVGVKSHFSKVLTNLIKNLAMVA